MQERAVSYRHKALESLAGAESEYANGRYNNCANRCYYACFQAAIVALLAARLQPSGTQWGHTFVQARFAGDLIQRQKRYPADLRDALMRTYSLRQTADYTTDLVTETQASRALRRSRTLVTTVLTREEERP